jgi:hypothetical protein
VLALVFVVVVVLCDANVVRVGSLRDIAQRELDPLLVARPRLRVGPLGRRLLAVLFARLLVRVHRVSRVGVTTRVALGSSLLIASAPRLPRLHVKIDRHT